MKIKYIFTEIFYCLKNEKLNDTSTKLCISFLLVVGLNFLFKCLFDYNNINSFEIIKKFLLIDFNIINELNEKNEFNLYFKFQAFKFHLILSMAFTFTFLISINIGKDFKIKLYKIILLLSVPILIYIYSSFVLNIPENEKIFLYGNFLVLTISFLYISLFIEKIRYRFLLLIFTNILIFFMGLFVYIYQYFLIYFVLFLFLCDIKNIVCQLIMKNRKIILFIIYLFVLMEQIEEKINILQKKSCFFKYIFYKTKTIFGKIKFLFNNVYIIVISSFIIYSLCVVFINLHSFASVSDLKLFLEIIFINNKVYRDSVILLFMIFTIIVSLFYLFYLLKEKYFATSNLENEYLLFALSIALMIPGFFNCFFLIPIIFCVLIKYMKINIRNLTSYSYDFIIIYVIYKLSLIYIPTFKSFM